MGVKIKGTYLGGLRVEMRHGPSDVVVNTDPPLDNGGRGESFSPTDLVVTALGSCMMTIIALWGKREKIQVEPMVVDMEKIMQNSPERRISQIKVDLSLPHSLNESQREKAVTIARQCPVALSIRPDIEIKLSTRFV
jgi:putative redox protein